MTADDRADLFVYGSLMSPPVWTRLVAGAHPRVVASLRGYRRFCVRGESYPGITAAAVAPFGPAGETDRVAGCLYRGLTPAELAVLDRFEGPDYRRSRVAVELVGPPPGVAPAWTYVYLPIERLEPRPWDAVAFERDRLARFLADFPPPDQAAGRSERR